MKKLVVPIGILLLIIGSNMLFAEKKGEEKPMRTEAAEAVTVTTNLHYTGKYCGECHEKTPKKGGNKFLRFGGDFTQLCKCHGYTSSNYLHPVDIEPSEEKKAKIPKKEFPLSNGKVTCSTCHDIYMQCQDSPQLNQFNKRFLRGAPYVRRTDLCFKCHDEKKYKMLDPHNQLNENGDIIAEKCLYCHVEKPDEKTATFKEVKLIGNLEILCQRCHGERIHPANANHLHKPSEVTLAIMKEGEKQYGIVLPLDSDGRISCPTCHNPHEKGVIPADRSGAKGAGEKFRHRLPGQICMACHQK